MNQAEVARLVELSEGRAYACFVGGAPPTLAKRFDLAVHRVGSGIVLVAGGLRDDLILNRVLGLGLSEPVTASTVVELDRLYEARGVERYALEISPASQPSELSSEWREWGFLPVQQTVMLYRGVEPLEEATDGAPRVQQVGAEHRRDFAALGCAVFAFGEPLPALLEATFDRPEWRQWLVFDGERPVAGAITYVAEGVAWIGWAATVADYRGRGAHRAITRAQVDDARASGCKWVTLETVTGSRKSPSQSLRNYGRLGWTEAYRRLVYVRSRSSDAAPAVAGSRP